jgi:hypothetical protein
MGGGSPDRMRVIVVARAASDDENTALASMRAGVEYRFKLYELAFDMRLYKRAAVDPYAKKSRRSRKRDCTK